SLNLALRTRRFRSEVFRAPLDPDTQARELLVDLVRAQGERSLICVLRRAFAHPGQRATLDALLRITPDVLVVCAREPFDAAFAGRARHVACTYGDDEASVEALADAIAGRLEPVGRLPVTLNTGFSAAR
ncbi:MAG TPA: hypothetical protein VGD50_03985, partial [Candidatus Baltobacteraceae bacterium]